MLRWRKYSNTAGIQTFSLANSVWLLAITLLANI